MKHTILEPTDLGEYVLLSGEGAAMLVSLRPDGWHHWLGDYLRPGLPKWSRPEFIGPLVPLADCPPEPAWTAWGGAPNTCVGLWMPLARGDDTCYYGPIPEPVEPSKQAWRIEFGEGRFVGHTNADTEQEAVAAIVRKLKAHKCI